MDKPRKAALKTAYKERMQKTKVTGLATSANMLRPHVLSQFTAIRAAWKQKLERRGGEVRNRAAGSQKRRRSLLHPLIERSRLSPEQPLDGVCYGRQASFADRTVDRKGVG